MLFIKQLKLKHQLFLLISISVIMMIIVQIFLYLSFEDLIKRKTELFINEMINQVYDEVVSMAKNIEDSATTIGYNRHVQEYMISDDIMRRKEIHLFILDVLGYIKSSRDNIHEIALTDHKGRTVTIANTNTNSLSMLAELNEKYQIYDDTNKEAMFTPLFMDEETGLYYYAYVFPIYSARPEYEFAKKIGTCTIVLKATDLQRKFPVDGITPNAHFLLTNQDNIIIAGNHNAPIGDAINVNKIREFGNLDMFDGNNRSIVQIKKILDLDWTIISVVPIHELIIDLESIKQIGYLIAFFMSVLLMVIGFVFTKSITSPISEIVNFVEKIGANTIKQRVNVSLPNEIGLIAKDINKMLDNVEALTKRIVLTQGQLYEAEILKTQAELSALQNQINPHFLYNTLTCIVGLSLAHGVEDIAKISLSMSRIFQYSIKGCEIVNIQDEIDCIQRYLSIMSIRYPEKYETNIHIDEEIYQYQTIKMILQPIVENAIYHGLEQTSSTGRLTINGSIVEKTIIFEVIDNGIGIDENTMNALEEKLNAPIESTALYVNENKNIGLVNINRRIKLKFGQQYGIRIERIVPLGTKVTVLLPALESSR